jgi:mRNA interferase RelE/StbE
MEFETSKKFDKLVYKIKDKEALKKLKNLISKISIAKTINEIPNLTPMVGYAGYYRIKAGDYRLGI